ncbi:carbohydrate-binding protein [Streptomyces sp. NPDC029080]|uniref:carbohydrate-binding protein n=1 Tax=Streptomyces sp. NPDC029080 TaxID=3155017 RepID=UPI0033D8F456
MTPGNNGASTPEDDDPFGYLYADGQARGAQPPSGGGYGYPNSVSRVRAVGERQYGQQQAPYGQPPQAAYGQTVPQQAPYGQPNAHYQAPETLPGGAASGVRAPQPAPPRRGPNTKGLLIGAVAVVAAVVIGIGMAMLNGNTDDDKSGDQAAPGATQSQTSEPKPSGSSSPASGELPKTDATAVQLVGGATKATDVKGAQSADGGYVTGLNQVGASLTWSVDNIPEDGPYTLFAHFSVVGEDQGMTVTVNGKPFATKLPLENYTHTSDGDLSKGWTTTYVWPTLTKGANTISISCQPGDKCDALIDQLWIKKGRVRH